MISIEQIKELQNRVETLGRCINIDEKRKDVAQRQEKTLAADFWDDPKEAEKFLKEMAGVKFWVTGYDKVAAGAEDLNVLLDKSERFDMSLLKDAPLCFKVKETAESALLYRITGSIGGQAVELNIYKK